MTSRLIQLWQEGEQSPWLDNLQRAYLTNGYLQSLIDKGIRGLTSNPTIFQKAIQDSIDYDDQFESLLRRGVRPLEAYWEMVCDDIVGASALFLPLYESSAGIDGYVSVEVDPHLAHHAHETIDAARSLRERIAQPNVMIKIPATTEGLQAITQLTREGCPINVTLIFSLERYDQVIDAYMTGLEERLSDRQPIDDIHSVASFFISRVDTEIDAQLERSGLSHGDPRMGRAAVNQARLAYQIFADRVRSERWEKLSSQGAQLQRPLWASTSTKNPTYSDTMYVDELIGPHTVNTLPEATLEAFLDHGKVQKTIDHDHDIAREQWDALANLGVNVCAVAEKLETDGVASFQKSFDDLMSSLETKAST